MQRRNWFYLRAVELANIETAASPSAEDKTNFAFAFNFVEKPITEDFKRRLITLASTAFINRELVNLAIVLANLLLIPVVIQSLGLKIARDTVGVNIMFFWQA